MIIFAVMSTAWLHAMAHTGTPQTGRKGLWGVLMRPAGLSHLQAHHKPFGSNAPYRFSKIFSQCLEKNRPVDKIVIGRALQKNDGENDERGKGRMSVIDEKEWRRKQKLARALHEGQKRLIRIRQHDARQRKAIQLEMVRLKEQRERARISQCIKGYEDILRLTGVKRLSVGLTDREGFEALGKFLEFVLGLDDPEQVRFYQAIVAACENEMLRNG